MDFQDSSYKCAFIIILISGNRGDPDDFEQSPLEIVRNDVEDEEAIIAQREITDTARNLSGDPNIITDSQENGLLNLFRGLRCGVVRIKQLLRVLGS